MLRNYGEALQKCGPKAALDRTLWLAATSRNAAAIRRELVADVIEACLSPGVMTFDQLTNTILAGSEATSDAGEQRGAAARLQTTVIPPSIARELLRRVIQSLLDRKRLSHFRESARRNGFVDLVAVHIRELKQHGLDAATYAKAAAHHDRSAEHRELAMIYTEYQHQLDSHALCDDEGRHLAAISRLAADQCP